MSCTRVVFNTRERAVSTDVNRLQSLRDRDTAELFRHWLLAAVTEESSDGVATLPASVTSPATGVILSGFLVRPESGGSNLAIDPGVAVVVDPDTSPSADDSPAKIIIDPGCSLSAAFVSNAGPGARIDVVEVARARADRDGLGNVDSPSLVLETSSRDIYNPVTGLFSSATVNKVVTVGRFTYRVRRGTAGGGFPGTAAGWLPLLVAAVPTTATSWDDCAMWDVRPLMADRLDAPTNANDGYPHRRENGGAIAQLTTLDTGPLVIRGVLAASLGRVRAGGEIPSAGYDVENTYGESAGWSTSIATRECWYLYAAMPFGLPRWAEYKGSPRMPTGFRGIPIATTTKPSDVRGLPSSALSFPANTNLAGSTSNAVALVAGGTKTSGAQRVFPVTVCDGELTETIGSSATNGQIATNVTLSSDVATVVFDDSAGYYPPNARELIIDVTFAVASGSANASTNVFMSIVDALRGSVTEGQTLFTERRPLLLNGSGAGSAVFRAKVSLRPTYPHDLGPHARNFVFNAGGIGGLGGSATVSVTVVGWRF